MDGGIGNHANQRLCLEIEPRAGPEHPKHSFTRIIAEFFHDGVVINTLGHSLDGGLTHQARAYRIALLPYFRFGHGFSPFWLMHQSLSWKEVAWKQTEGQ